jgi:NADH dehydrogenase [ubiquinone] 1 alpha subcomplex assembly factor 7
MAFIQLRRSVFSAIRRNQVRNFVAAKISAKVLRTSTPMMNCRFIHPFIRSFNTKNSIDKTLSVGANKSGTVRTSETDLLKVIKDYIYMRGPISISEYMRIALLHPQLGYYCRSDAFGTKGDFTTAPEISPLFGEMIGIWCLSMWIDLGRPSKINIVELGPGRGTLMADILRVCKSFPDFQNAIAVNFVERSALLRNTQCEKLGCMNVTEILNDKGEKIERGDNPGKPEQNETMIGYYSKNDNVKVSWFEEIELIPTKQGIPSIFIAQEFFDALPVHQFQLTKEGWCERLVDIETSNNGQHHLRMVLSQTPTIASRAFFKGNKNSKINLNTIVKNSYTEDTGSHNINNSNNTFVTSPSILHNTDNIHGANVGENDEDFNSIEFCPAGIGTAQTIAKRIQEDNGAALIIDYGNADTVSSSIRGIKDHKFVSALQEPGLIDLSADVDFKALKYGVDLIKDMECTNIVGQGSFLKNMGIDYRMGALLSNAKNDDELAEQLISGYERLVDGNDGMGDLYKVMGIYNKNTKHVVGGKENQITGFFEPSK